MANPQPMKKIITLLIILPFFIHAQTIISVVKNYSVSFSTPVKVNSSHSGNRLYYTYNKSNGPIVQKNDLDGNPLKTITISDSTARTSFISVSGGTVFLCGTRSFSSAILPFICSLDTGLNGINFYKEYSSLTSTTITPLDMIRCSTGEIVVVGSASTSTAAINRGYFLCVNASNGNLISQNTYTTTGSCRLRAVTQISNNSLMVYGGNSPSQPGGFVTRMNKNGIPLGTPIQLSVCDPCPLFKLRKLNNSTVLMFYQGTCVKLDTALSFSAKQTCSDAFATYTNGDLMDNKIIFWRGTGVNNRMVMYDTSYAFVSGFDYLSSVYPLAEAVTVHWTPTYIYFVYGSSSISNFEFMKTQSLGGTSCSTGFTSTIGVTSLMPSPASITFTNHTYSNNLNFFPTIISTQHSNSCVTMINIDELKKEKMTIKKLDDTYFLTSAAEISLIEVFDLTGRKILSKKIESQTTTIDLSSYNSGIYILNAFMEGETQSYKLLK